MRSQTQKAKCGPVIVNISTRQRPVPTIPSLEYLLERRARLAPMRETLERLEKKWNDDMDVFTRARSLISPPTPL